MKLITCFNGILRAIPLEEIVLYPSGNEQPENHPRPLGCLTTRIMLRVPSNIDPRNTGRTTVPVNATDKTTDEQTDKPKTAGLSHVVARQWPQNDAAIHDNLRIYRPSLWCFINPENVENFRKNPWNIDKYNTFVETTSLPSWYTDCDKFAAYLLRKAVESDTFDYAELVAAGFIDT